MALLVLVVATDVILAGAAMAVRTDISGARTVPMTVANEAHDVFVVSAPSGHAISLHVSVTSGGPVDVYTTTSSGYSQYTSPTATSFSYYPARSQTSTTNFDSRVAPDSDVVYVIVDNDNVTTAGAMSQGPVSYTATFTDASTAFDWIPGVIILFLLLFGGVIIRVVLRSRSAKRSATQAWSTQGAPPAYGAAPPAYPGATSQSMYAPPAYGGAPPAYPGQAPAYGSSAQTAPCPTCGSPVAIGAAACAKCGMSLSWG